jgi:hypothetical protein
MGDLIWRVPGWQILGNEKLELSNSGGPYAEGRKVRQCAEAEAENHKDGSLLHERISARDSQIDNRKFGFLRSQVTGQKSRETWR